MQVCVITIMDPGVTHGKKASEIDHPPWWGPVERRSPSRDPRGARRDDRAADGPHIRKARDRGDRDREETGSVRLRHTVRETPDCREYLRRRSDPRAGGAGKIPRAEGGPDPLHR